MWLDLNTEGGSGSEKILDTSDILLACAVVWVGIVDGVLLEERLKTELLGGKESSSKQVSSVDETI